MRCANACASAGFSMGSLVPGTVGTSARRASWRPDEGEARVRTGARQRGIFREKPIAGVQGIATGAARDIHELVDAEIALARRRGADGIGFIGETDVKRFAVGLTEDCDGADTQFAAGAQYAHGDFTAIGNQDFFEHKMIERGASLTRREAGATNPQSFCASVKLIHELFQILPLDEDDVIFLQRLLEFGAGDNIIVALPPGGAVVRVIQSYSLKLRIIMTEVDNYFGETGFQVLHGVDIKIFPFAGRNRGVGDYEGINNDIFVGE